MDSTNSLHKSIASLPVLEMQSAVRVKAFYVKWELQTDALNASKAAAMHNAVFVIAIVYQANNLIITQPYVSKYSFSSQRYKTE